MNLYRTASCIKIAPAEMLEDGDWRSVSVKSEAGGLILTGITAQDHDHLVNYCENHDPDQLRGVVVALHLKDRQDGDPDAVNLLALPVRGQVIRHQDRYYVVSMVIQSSKGSAAVFAKRAEINDFWAFDISALLSRSSGNS